MSDTIKQAGIKQADGTYLMKDIGVDYTNVDGLSTAAKSFEAFSADKATADKNNKDITEYVASISKNGENISVQSGDPTATPVDVDLSMTGATAVDNGEAGFVPQPTVADNAKFLKGDGTWAIPQVTTYTGSDNIKIDGTTNAIDLTDSTVSSGTYGPSADVTGSNGVTISVPKFTVDAKGRLTSAGTQTYTSVDTTYSAGTGLSLSGTSFRLGSHASTGTGYGQGSGSNFGHVKLSDTYASLVSGADAAGGVAASQNALYNAYDTLNGHLAQTNYKIEEIQSHSSDTFIKKMKLLCRSNSNVIELNESFKNYDAIYVSSFTKSANIGSSTSTSIFAFSEDINVGDNIMLLEESTYTNWSKVFLTISSETSFTTTKTYYTTVIGINF